MKNDTVVSLKDVLSLDLFNKCQILTKEDQIDQGVQSINVMLDVEIIEWLEANQIILTTGKIFEKETTEQMVSLFEAIAQKGVSAVFIKINPYISQLPLEVIEVCNDNHLAVIDLDYEVTFTDIFTEVYHEMFSKQTSVLQRVETLHKDTMNVVVNGGNIEDVLKSIHKTISAPVFVRDYYFEDTYFLKDYFEDDYALLYENIDSSIFDSKNNKMIVDRMAYKEEVVERLVIPIFVKNKVHGHIVAYGKESPFTNYDQLGLETASNIIALEFLKKISVQEVENKYKIEFFDDLISMDEIRRSKAIDRAGNFRFAENAYYVILDIDLQMPSHLSEADLVFKAAYLIEMICKDLGRSYMILNKSDSIYILVMLKEGENLSVVKRYVEYIYDILSSKIKKGQTSIGAGRIYQGLSQVHLSLNDATKALEAAKYYLPDHQVYFEEMGIYKILSQPSIQNELSLFYKDTLEKLVQYDTRKDTELVKTLEVYFECNGNLKKMSESLFTHYNTILYRLNRIQDILQLTLDNEEQRYAIHTALKFNRMRHQSS